MPSPDFRSTWFASAVNKHSDVTGATTLPDGLVRITRETVDETVTGWTRERRRLPTITVAPLGNPRIDRDVVETVLAEVLPTAIVLVPKSGHYDWEARELAMEHGSTILTVKELFAFMGADDPRPFVDKNVAHSRERLGQHSKVIDCSMICESSVRLQRKGSLSDVTVAIEYEYEFSEEAVVRAISRHPAADVILNANPYGTVTTAAYWHARDAEIPVYKLSELMGALNYDGDQFRNYEPPSPRRGANY